MSGWLCIESWRNYGATVDRVRGNAGWASLHNSADAIADQGKRYPWPDRHRVQSLVCGDREDSGSLHGEIGFMVITWGERDPRQAKPPKFMKFIPTFKEDKRTLRLTHD